LSRALHGLLAGGLLLFTLGSQASGSWSGVVTHVTDGDTLWVQPARRSVAVKVRLDGIDAPEVCQEWGEPSRQLLQRRLLHRPVTVHPRRHDSFGRLLVRIEHGGQDVGAWMVSQGAAWSYQFRRNAGPYALIEQRSRQAGAGLFADPNALRPRVFRLRHGPCHA
jgi:endonuclease YncB( thermonuclease family)